MREYSLKPITATLFPVASQSPVVELVATSLIKTVSREALVDVAFVVPLQELETGMVHITGASNIYFIRIVFDDKGNISSVKNTLYF